MEGEQGLHTLKANQGVSSLLGPSGEPRPDKSEKKRSESFSKNW